MNFKYEYLVSFICNGGYGKITITRNKSIKSGNDIKNIEGFIEKEYSRKKVAINNYNLLRKIRVS